MLNLVTLVVMSFRLKTLSLVKSCVDLFCIYLHIYILWSSPCLVPCLSRLWFCHIPTLGNVYVCGAVSKIYFNCFRVVETLNRMSYPVPGGYSGQVRRMYHFLWTKLQVQNSSTILLTPSLCRPIVFLLPRDCPPFPSPFFPYVKQISSVSVFLLFCGPNIFLLSQHFFSYTGQKIPFSKYFPSPFSPLKTKIVFQKFKTLEKHKAECA